MQQIQLDIHGHPLSSDLKDIQKHHKQHLIECTENVEDIKFSPSSCEHYMDMMVVYDQNKRHSQLALLESGVSHETYFKKHLQYVGTECMSIDRLFRWCHRLKCTPHSVMIAGLPGVGKTTLLKKFVCEWANGKIYQRFSFVFFFQFRELNRLDTISLETMVLQLYPYLQSQLANILQFPEKILFIFDGLDESIHEIDFRSCKLCSNVNQIHNVGAIVVGLVRQSLLKGCSVVVSSKTSRAMQKDIQAFRRITEIMGFNPVDREIYFQKFFKEKTLSDQVFSYVKDNGALYSFCFIPTFCRIVCETLSVHFNAQPMNNQNLSALPKTMTQLMTGFVGKILSSHRQDKSHVRKLLSSIGRMAGYGLSKGIFAFTEDVLKTFGVDATSDLLQLFMVKNGHPPNVTFSFLHLLLLDFLAALVHYINYSPEKLDELLDKTRSYKDHHDEMFFGFLCGLSHQSTRSILSPYLGKLSSRAITRAVKSVSAWLLKQSTSEARKFVDSRYNKRSCVTVFYYLYEAQNRDLVREALGSRRKLDLSGTIVTPLDCMVLSFILESCKNFEELQLNGCTLSTESWRKFTPHLHNFTVVGLTSTKMGNDGIQVICPAFLNPESKIQTLWLGYNNLTDISCIYLAPVIRNNQSLKRLDLSHNRLSGPHFSDLMAALSSPACRIEELNLDSAGLIETSCIQLASGLRNNQSLRKLYLSRNYLNSPYFGDLADALSGPTCKIKELELSEILLEDEHAPLLVTLSNNLNLTHLDLSKNHMTDASVGHITDLILKSSNLKEISLCFNHRITSEKRENLRNLKVQKPGLFVFID
ncbi:NACHT, LRR and PYD domains-containing protein 3-like isoform 2-T2 [Leptodactylus fuscus]